MSQPKPLSFYLLALLACLLWSTAFVGIKIGLRYWPPLTLAGLRFTLAGLLLFPFSGGITAYVESFKVHGKTILILAGFSFLICAITNTGLSLVAGATGAVVIGSSPLFAALVAHFYMTDDKMTPLKSVSILLGLLGILLLSLPKHAEAVFYPQETLGILILISGCIVSAVSDTLIASDQKYDYPLAVNSSQMFLGGFTLFCLALPLEGLPNFAQPLVFYAALAWLAFISAVAITLWLILLQNPAAKVSRLSIWKFIIPVLGALLSWLILPNEYPTLGLVIGMSLVAIAVLISNLEELSG